MQRPEKQDIYTRITSQIVNQLEKGVRPWVRPWNAEHAAGRITRPLRHNGKPYSGINVLSLWASAVAQNFAAPIWMTFRQATQLDGHIRKGTKGSLVVYADSLTRKETDDMEIHWGLSKTFGTAQALEPMGTIPESIPLNISLGTECGNCHKPVNYVKHHAEQKEASGEWFHRDDGSPNCSVPFQNNKARKASPVVIPNDALFAELRKYDCDT